MKILIITNLFPPVVLGGYEILCGQVVEALEQRGHFVTILTSNQDDVSSTGGILRELHLFQPFGKPVNGSMRREKRATSHHNAAITRTVLQDGPFDVVFIWSLLRLTLSPARVAEQSGIPVVYTFNDEHPGGYLPARFAFTPKKFARWILDLTWWRDLTNGGLGFTNTTCISGLLKHNLVDSGMPIETSKIIYQGIPIERFPLRSDPTISSEPIRLLYTGQLHEYKGVHTLLEALALLAKSGSPKRYSCTIVGRGTAVYEEKLRKMADDLPVPVEFTGRVGHDRMGSIYREHDIFVFPSIWPEPFGLTHLEAMASGLPVISTVNGGQGEFLEEGSNALTFSPGQSEQLARQILRLSEDAQLYHALVEAGREIVENKFTFARYVSELEELLRSAIGLRRQWG